MGISAGLPPSPDHREAGGARAVIDIELWPLAVKERVQAEKFCCAQ